MCVCVCVCVSVCMHVLCVLCVDLLVGEALGRVDVVLKDFQRNLVQSVACGPGGVSGEIELSGECGVGGVASSMSMVIREAKDDHRRTGPVHQ